LEGEREGLFGFTPPPNIQNNVVALLYCRNWRKCICDSAT